MLNLCNRGMIHLASNPRQNIYDGIVTGLYFMPPTTLAAATAAIASAGALYVIKPETMLNQIVIVAISSGLSWAAAVAVHRAGLNLWKKRHAELEAMKGNEITQQDERALRDLIGEIAQKHHLESE